MLKKYIFKVFLLRFIFFVGLHTLVIGCTESTLQKVTPQHREVYQEARTALENGDYTTARSLYEQLIEETQVDVLRSVARLELSHAALRSGDPARALKEVDILLSEEGSQALNKGYIYILSAVAAHEYARQFAALPDRDEDEYERLLNNAFIRLNLVLTHYPSADPQGILIKRLHILHNERAQYEIQKLKTTLEAEDYETAQQRARYIQKNYADTEAVSNNSALLEEVLRE